MSDTGHYRLAGILLICTLACACDNGAKQAVRKNKTTASTLPAPSYLFVITASGPGSITSRSIGVQTAAAISYSGRYYLLMSDVTNDSITAEGDWTTQHIDRPHHRIRLILSRVPTEPGEYEVGRLEYTMRDERMTCTDEWPSGSLRGALDIITVSNDGSRLTAMLEVKTKNGASFGGSVALGF